MDPVSETPDQRMSCLQQMSLTQQMRLAHETQDQREARLKQMCIVQQMRLTHETPDQRETRLEEVSLAQQMGLTQTLDLREVLSFHCPRETILKEHHVTRKLLI